MKTKTMFLSIIFTLITVTTIFASNSRDNINTYEKEVSLKTPFFTSEKPNDFLDYLNNTFQEIKVNEIKSLLEEDGEVFFYTLSYEVKLFEDITSIVFYKSKSYGNTSSVEVTTFVLNINEEKIYTLKDFLGQDAYNIASKEVKRQMLEKEEDFFIDQFKSVNESTGFYINQNGNIVIIFDKYDIAPGVFGTPEFIIT